MTCRAVDNCKVFFLVFGCREEISQKRMNSIRGIDNHERLDEELYHDFETDEARKV